MAGQKNGAKVKPEYNSMFAEHIDVKILELIEEIGDVELKDLGHFLEYLSKTLYFHAVVVAKLSHHLQVGVVVRQSDK